MQKYTIRYEYGVHGSDYMDISCDAYDYDDALEKTYRVLQHEIGQFAAGRATEHLLSIE